VSAEQVERLAEQTAVLTTALDVVDIHGIDQAQGRRAATTAVTAVDALLGELHRLRADLVADLARTRPV
jgi:hypothetical protein